MATGSAARSSMRVLPATPGARLQAQENGCGPGAVVRWFAGARIALRAWFAIRVSLERVRADRKDAKSDRAAKSRWRGGGWQSGWWWGLLVFWVAVRMNA